MLSRTASRTGQEISVERASFSLFNQNLDITQTEVEHKLRFRFLNVVALALFCDYLLLTLCVPILPEIFGDNFSPLMIGLVFASKPIFQFLANPYMGAIVDKHGPKYPLLLGVIVLCLSTFLFAYGLSLDNNLQTAYIIVLVARSVQGLASASTMSAGMTLAALTHHESNRGTAMGIAMIGVALGTLSGPPIGGVMGYFLPIWSPYIVVGGMLFCNALAQGFVLHCTNREIPVYIKEHEVQPPSRRSSIASRDGNHHEGPKVSTPAQAASSPASSPARVEEEQEEEVTIMTLLQHRQILFIATVAMVGNCCIGLIEPLIPLFLKKEFDQNILQQGLIFTTATLSYLIFTPIAGVMSDTYPKWLCLAMGLLSIGFGFVFLLDSYDIPRICISLFFIGSGMSFVDTPSLPLLSEIIERENLNAAGQVYALSDMALCIGFAIGPILGPLLQYIFGGGGRGFRLASLTVGLICLALLPFTPAILRNSSSNDGITSRDTLSGHKVEFIAAVEANSTANPSKVKEDKKDSSDVKNAMHNQV